MFNSIDLMAVKNFNWFHKTVTQGGCTYLTSQDDPSSSDTRHLIHSLGGLNNKSLAQCSFDLVNTSNPSGEIVRQGNCIWFQNLMWNWSYL